MTIYLNPADWRIWFILLYMFVGAMICLDAMASLEIWNKEWHNSNPFYFRWINYCINLAIWMTIGPIWFGWAILNCVFPDNTNRGTKG